MKHLLFALLIVFSACENNQKTEKQSTELSLEQKIKQHSNKLDSNFKYVEGYFCYSEIIEIDKQLQPIVRFKYMQIYQDFNNSIAFDITFKPSKDSSATARKSGHILNFKEVYSEALLNTNLNAYLELQVIYDLPFPDDSEYKVWILKLTVSQFLKLIPCKNMVKVLSVKPKYF